MSILYTPSGLTGFQNISIPGVTFDGKMIHNDANLDLQVYDVTGRKIIGSNKSIDMSSRAKGIYIVKSINSTLKLDLNK